MSKRKTKRTVTDPKEDRCVIYYSKDDKCWIAHSLYTDQIGTGKSVLFALVKLMTVVDSLFAIYKEQKDIRVWRDAPQEIFKKAETSTPLSKMLYGIAHRIARGQWPKKKVLPDYHFSPQKFYSAGLSSVTV
jgi:hypothetical protein